MDFYKIAVKVNNADEQEIVYKIFEEKTGLKLGLSLEYRDWDSSYPYVCVNIEREGITSIKERNTRSIERISFNDFINNLESYQPTLEIQQCKYKSNPNKLIHTSLKNKYANQFSSMIKSQWR